MRAEGLRKALLRGRARTQQIRVNTQAAVPEEYVSRTRLNLDQLLSCTLPGVCNRPPFRQPCRDKTPHFPGGRDYELLMLLASHVAVFGHVSLCGWCEIGSRQSIEYYFYHPHDRNFPTWSSNTCIRVCSPKPARVERLIYQL